MSSLVRWCSLPFHQLLLSPLIFSSPPSSHLCLSNLLHFITHLCPSLHPSVSEFWHGPVGNEAAAKGCASDCEASWPRAHVLPGGARFCQLLLLLPLAPSALQKGTQLCQYTQVMWMSHLLDSCTVYNDWQNCEWNVCMWLRCAWMDVVMWLASRAGCDTCRLWEVLWTGHPCPNFHLLVAVALLDTEKDTIMENKFGFTEILKVRTTCFPEFVCVWHKYIFSLLVCVMDILFAKRILCKIIFVGSEEVKFYYPFLRWYLL